MAFVHGKDSIVVVDGTTITAYTDNTALNRTMDAAEVTVFSQDDRAYIAGLRGASLMFSGPWDATADSAWNGAQDLATIAWSYSPDNGTTTYSGNGFVTAYAPSGPVGDRVAWSATVQVTGAVSRA